jgi:7-alpha-hydroxysteroid dehydrogenase
MTQQAPATSQGELFGLSGQAAIVTGAGKGIGAAIAVALADAGADVALIARTRADLERVSTRVTATGRRALIHPADLRDSTTLPGVIDDAVSNFGRLDILVNNAGGSVPKPFPEVRIDQFESEFCLDVLVAFELTRLAVPHFLATGHGSVINISSVIGRNAYRSTLVPSTIKAAQSQLTRVLAADLSPRIRVNAILPGAIETDPMRGYLDTHPPEVRTTITQRIPMRRLGAPEDIAHAAVFLASPAASWITGKLLEVDGGAYGEIMPSALPDL